MPVPEVTRRYEPTAEFQTLVEEVRQKFKDAAEEREGEGLEYAYGVMDALSFIWAGMPEDAGDLYGATNSRFAELAREADL